MESSGGIAIPMLYTRGSHYEVGYQIGSAFRDKIMTYFQASKLVSGKLLPFYDHRKGRDIVESYLKDTTECFPKYIREIKGIANGVGMPFEKLFILNIGKEVYNCHINELKDSSEDDSGCSTIMINKPDLKLLVHNEDSDPTVRMLGYIVRAHVIDDGHEEDFTAFTMPGALSGITFSFNNHGMIFTVNGLYPKLAQPGATPRYFLNRAMLSATNVNDVLKLVRNDGHGCAFGFHVNLGSVEHSSNMWGVEVAPGKSVSQVHLHTIEEQSDPTKMCCYFHTNHYLHLDVENMTATQSTFARMNRIKEFQSPSTFSHIRNILGDTNHKKYPIYRTPSEFDLSETVATAKYDLIRNKLDIFSGNIKFEPNPLMTLSLV